jgi:hypothetical protein
VVGQVRPAWVARVAPGSFASTVSAHREATWVNHASVVGNSGSVCSATDVCVLSSAAGNAGQACLFGSTCATGLVCVNNVCAYGGNAGQPCLTGGVCNTGNVCINGVCQVSPCSTGQTLCGSTCTNLQTDFQNCGTCSNVCSSGVCSAGICAAPTCTDGVKNGTETGVDCGGGSCPTCATGQTCLSNSDCTSNVCSNGVCQ